MESLWNPYGTCGNSLWGPYEFHMEVVKQYMNQ